MCIKTFYKILNIKKYDLNSKYLIFSAIGDPSSFKDILLENNFDISRELIFSDHYKFKHEDIKKIQLLAERDNLKIITTEKDYIKIPDKFKGNIDQLTIDLIIRNATIWMNQFIYSSKIRLVKNHQKPFSIVKIKIPFSHQILRHHHHLLRSHHILRHRHLQKPWNRNKL